MSNAGKDGAIDWTGTTTDWQRHGGDICVLPVGSVEQHGPHLPLNTDCIEAEHFARMIAGHLGAALLPLQAYANCLEHSGFRGSVTLRPETLMQVVRDIADAVEQQGFRILVLLNGHGGNFSLTPVVRDINRMDRRLKILLVPFWEFSEPGLAAEGASRGKEIHAGEWETSLMLALRPDLVRREQASDMQAPADGRPGLEQRDLSWFGVGHYNPAGPVGFPSLATTEKGEAIVASIRARMLAYVEDRIERLRRAPRYAGMAGLCVRPLQKGDLEEAMRLKNLARWNQVSADWELCLRLSPEGCLGLFQNGRLLGTAVTIGYGSRVAWIGMVLVDPEYRRMGFATRLMEAALAHAKSVPTLMLDASPAGRPLYARLGFREVGSLNRMIGGARAPAEPGDARPLEEAELKEAMLLDSAAAGYDRSDLIRSLWRRRPELARGLRQGGRLTAFCLGRDGVEFAQIGPVIAGTEDDAMAVVRAALASAGGSPVVFDVPTEKAGMIEFLRRSGMTVQRGFTRMALGENPPTGRPGTVYAGAGPEFG